MSLQSVHTTQLRLFVEGLKPFLKPRFTAPPRKTNKGRPRIAPLWLLVALGVVKHAVDLTWRQYAHALQQAPVKALLEEFGATKPPSKSTLHQAWGYSLHGALREALIEMRWAIAYCQQPQGVGHRQH